MGMKERIIGSKNSGAVQFLALIWCAAFLSFGCAATHTLDAVTDPTGLESLNGKIKDQWVMVTLKSGQKIYAENISIRSDSTGFDELNGRAGVSVPTTSISQIRWNDHVGGIGRGVIFGGAVGAIITAIFHPELFGDMGGGVHPLSIADGAFIGCVLGAWPGLVVGQQHVYELRSDSTQSSE